MQVPCYCQPSLITESYTIILNHMFFPLPFGVLLSFLWKEKAGIYVQIFMLKSPLECPSKQLPVKSSIPHLVLKAPIEFSSLKPKQAPTKLLRKISIDLPKTNISLHCLGEPVACFAVISHVPPRYAFWLSAMHVLCQDGPKKKKKSVFLNLPFEIYLGTMKTIILLISFDLLHIFDGKKCYQLTVV